MELTNGNIFKWWYAKGISSYNDLLEEGTAQLTAMTRDGKIVKKAVPLFIEQGQIAVADCGLDGKFFLTPNQWVCPQKTEKVSKYWLIEKGSQKPNTPSILGIYTKVDDGVAVLPLPQGVELFGIPSTGNSTLTHRVIDAIVPIGDEKCIAFSEEGSTCLFIGDRETDESVIKIYLNRIKR